MKIIIVTDHIKGDTGWSRYAKDLATGLQRSGHDILCIVKDADNSVNIQQKEILKDPILYLSNIYTMFSTAIKCRKLFKEFQPDIVHFIVEPYSTIIPFLNTKGYQLVLTTHSTFAYLPNLVSGIKNTLLVYLAKNIYKKVSFLVCVSDYTRDYLFSCTKK